MGAVVVVASSDPAQVNTRLDDDLRDLAAELMYDGERIGWRGS